MMKDYESLMGMAPLVIEQRYSARES